MDTGATMNFFLLGAPVKNVQPASTSIYIKLPEVSKLKSTHICNLDIAGILEEAKRAHIVPGLAHASLISNRVLCDSGCKVKYDEDICSVYYNNKLVYKEGREPQTIVWILPL